MNAAKCECGRAVHHNGECIEIWYFGAHLVKWTTAALEVRFAQCWDSNQLEPMSMIRAELSLRDAMPCAPLDHQYRFDSRTRQYILHRKPR